MKQRRSRQSWALSRLVAWLLVCLPLVGPAGAQRLDFATWNLEWFNGRTRGFPEYQHGGPKYAPRSDYGIAATASVIRKHGLDLVGLQEIQSQRDLNRLLACLPGFQGQVLADKAVQHCALIWDTQSCAVTLRPAVTKLAITSGCRQGLWASVRAGNFDLEVLVTHLANDDDQVRQQVAVIREWLRNGGKDEDVLIAGDMNLTPREKPLRSLLADTLLAWAFGGVKPLPPTRPGWPGGSGKGKTIDHLFMTRTCHDHERWGAARVPREDLAFRGRYRELVSDHLPVIQAFNTDIDND